MKTLMKTACAAAMLALSALPGWAQGKVIKMGTHIYEDLTPITGITKRVLEQKGYTVEVTEFSEWGIAYAALAKGDIEVLASQIDYVAQDYWERNKRRLEKISPVSHGLYQAVAVPPYVDIQSMEDLNAHADKFGGRIVGIESGSGLMREAAQAMGEYGLSLQLVEGSTAAMTAALKSAIDRNEWIAVTVWEPSWMMHSYKLRFLDDPKGIFAPPQSYYWIGQAGFSEKNPDVREAMAGIYVPLAVINGINGAVSEGKTMDQAVDDWMAANTDLVARWSNLKDY